MDLPGSKDTLSDFSKLLMGLVKYAINHKEGNLDILAIASVICHTEAAIRIGMDWLASMGKLNILDRQNMVLKLAFIDLPCSGDEPAVRKKLQKLLDETAAYRSYYRRCSPGQLLPPA